MDLKPRLLYFYYKIIKGIVLPRDLIKESVNKNRDKIAVSESDKKHTYFEIYQRAKRLSNSLSNIGLKKGDRVALFMYNSKEYFEIRIAAYLSGIVLIPLVYDLSIDDIKYILKDCEPKAIIYHKELLSETIKDSGVKIFISIPDDYEKLVSEGKPVESEADLSLDDLASINFSSGSTGRPKGILLTQGSWMNSFYNYAINSSKKLKEEIRIIHVLPLATAGGAAFLPAFFIGAKNYFLKEFNEQNLVDLIERYDINSVFLAPSHLNLLTDFCRNKGIKPKIENIIVGTDIMHKEKFKEAIEFFGPIIQEGYGMAEILPPLSLMCSKDYLKDESRLLSAGKPLSGIKVKIVGEGERGAIAIKSSTVSKGYWNRPELDKKRFINGYYVSDDFGYIDNEGYLYVCGREQDLINKKDMVFKRDIEEVLHKYPGVLEAHAFVRNGQIQALVSLKRGMEINLEDILDFSKTMLKDNHPEKITVIKEIPKSATGKINRKMV